jgi:ABC-type oligopeptide transport system substrate-binding subunit
MAISERARRFFSRARFVFFLAACVLISGCVRRDPPADLTIINNGEPESLDPALHNRQPEMRIVIGLFEGLTRLDPKTARRFPVWRKAGKFRRTEKSTRFICARIWSGQPAIRSARMTWFIPGFAH